MKSLRKGVVFVALAIVTFACFLVGGLALGKTNNVNANADNFTFEMTAGTSVKLTEKEGLRFRVVMDEGTKDKIVNNSDINLSFLVAPLFNMREIVGENYQDLPQFIKVDANKEWIYEDSGMWYSNCVLTDIVPENRKLDFACIAYFEENGTRTYSTNGYIYNNLYATLNSVVLDTNENYIDKILGNEVVKYTGGQADGFLYDWFGKVNDKTSENYAIVVSNQNQYDTLVSRCKDNAKISEDKMILKLASGVVSSKDKDELLWTEMDTSSAESDTFFVEFKCDGRTLKKVSVAKGGKVSAPVLDKVTDNDGKTWEYGVWKDKDGNAVDFASSITADTVYTGTLIRKLNLEDSEYAINNGHNKVTVGELGEANEIIKISYGSACKDLTVAVEGKTLTFSPKGGASASGKVVSFKIELKDANGNYYNVYKKMAYNFDGCILENTSDMVDLYANFPNYIHSDIKVVSDINMVGVETINKSFSATVVQPYFGTFDGQNHVISNLNTWAGIIPSIGETGVVKNIALTNMYSSATNGGFAVHLNNGTIENCYFEGCKKADNDKDNVAFTYFNGGVHKISNVVVVMSKDDVSKNQAFGITRGTLPTNWSNVYVVNDGCNGYECGEGLDASTHKDIEGAYLYSSIEEMKADINGQVPTGFDTSVWTISASGELVMKCAEKVPDVVISNKDEFLKWYQDDFMSVYDKNQYVVLTADIDLAGFSYNPGDTRKNAEFNGTFDGNGHTISNLTTGFGVLSSIAPSGVVKNVSFVNYTAINVWSPFAGNWLKGSMENVYIEGQFKAGLTLQNGGSRLFFYGFNQSTTNVKNVVLFVHQPLDGTFNAGEIDSRLGYSVSAKGLYAICDGIFADNSTVPVVAGSSNGIYYYNSAEEFTGKVKSLPSGFSDKIWSMEMGIPMLKGAVSKYDKPQNDIVINPVSDIQLNKPITLTANKEVTWSVEGLTDGYTLNGNVLTLTSFENAGIAFSVVATGEPEGLFAYRTQARLDNLRLSVTFTDKGNVEFGLNQNGLKITAPNSETVSSVFVDDTDVTDECSLSGSVATVLGSLLSNGTSIKIITTGGGYSYTVVAYDYLIETAEEFDGWFKDYIGATGGFNKQVILNKDIVLDGNTTYNTASTQPFAGTFDGRGHYVQNLKTAQGMFWRLSGTVKNLAVINTTTTDSYMPFVGYYIHGSAVISDLYYQGTQAGGPWENDSHQVTGFYQNIDNSANITNTVVILDRVTGYESDPISKSVVNSNSLYVVNNCSGGSTVSGNAHYYKNVAEFKDSVSTLPSGFSSDVWEMVDGVLTFKSAKSYYESFKDSLGTLTVSEINEIKTGVSTALSANKTVTWSVIGLNANEYELNGNEITVSESVAHGQRVKIVATYINGIIVLTKELSVVVKTSNVDLGEITVGLNQAEIEIEISSGETVTDVSFDGVPFYSGYSSTDGKAVLGAALFSSYKNGDSVLLKIKTDGSIYSATVQIVDVAICNASEFDAWYTEFLGYTTTAKNNGEDYVYIKHVVLTDNIVLSGTKVYTTHYEPSNIGVIFAGTFDGMGHYIQNLKTTQGMFWKISGTVKNLAVTNTTTTHNYMPFMGYYAYTSTVFSNVYYQGTQSGTAWENDNHQVNGFYQHVASTATVKNMVIIVDRVTGYESDPISKVEVNSDSLYVVNTTSSGTTLSKNAHYYSSMSAFTSDVATLPPGFSSKYWKIVGGELMFKSIDVEEFVYGTNRTYANVQLDTGLTNVKIILNGVEKTSGFNYSKTTGVIKFFKNNCLGTLPIGASSVIIESTEKTYNYIVNVFDFAIGNTTEFNSWYSNYKDNLNARIVLTDNVDLGGSDIGNAVTNYWYVSDMGDGNPGNLFFNGIFDGSGYTISNFTENVGLIVGLGPNGVIKNLNLTNFVTKGSYGLLGCTWQGRVYNCYFEGKNNATDTVNGAVCNQTSGNYSAFVDVTVVVSSDLDHSTVPAIFGGVSSKMQNFIVVNNNSTGNPFGKASSLTGYRLYTSLIEKETDIRNYQIVMASEDANVITATNFIKANLDKAYVGGFDIVNVEEIDDSKELIVIGDRTAVNNAGIVVPDGAYIVKKVGNLVLIYASDSLDYQPAALKFLEYVLGFDDLGNQSIVYSNIATEMPDMDYENKVFIKSRVTGYTAAVLSYTTVHLDAGQTISGFNEKYGMGYTDNPIMTVPNRYYTSGMTTDGAYNKSIIYHTAFQFLPPEMYLNSATAITTEGGTPITHGAWYAEKMGGSPSGGWTSNPNQTSKSYMQLCYTARGGKYPGELEAMEKAVLEYMKYVVMLKDNLNKTYLPFMQLDNEQECGCDACKEKGTTLAQLEFLDDVIGRLNVWLNEQGDRRTIKGVMFAYKSSLEAPTTQEKFDNVAVMIAPIEANFVYDAYSDANTSFRNNMLAWSNVCAETFMWLYQSNFGWAYDYTNNKPYKWTDYHGLFKYYRDSNVGGYIDYFASVDEHLSWLKLCRDCKATFMFDQGSHNAKVSSGFSGLKNYIDSKALIDLNYVIVNYNKVVNDYFTRYFGPAATAMKDVFDKLNSAVKTLTANNGTGSIRDCLYSKWTKNALSPITTALNNAYIALNNAYADKSCAEYLEYKRRIDIESITPRFINADQGLGITSSYYTTNKQGVYNDMLALGFDRFAEPSGCELSALRDLWSVS